MIEGVIVAVLLLVAADFVWDVIGLGVALRAQGARVITGAEGMVGQIAVAESAFSRGPDGEVRGKVRIRGEIWDARLAEGCASDSGPGADLTVLAVEGLRLVVEPAAPGESR